MRLRLALASFLLSTAATAPAFASTEDDRIGVFVGMDWRALLLAGHASHGPGFQAGVILWDHLKLGVAGFARPGPINPKTFEVTPVDGQTYRGQSTVTLRSDGAVIGILVAPTFDVGDELNLEIPATVGQGAFGFYLTGQDRETPDGRRVSDWENDLLDGRDASGGLAIDAGVRLNWKLDTWIRPYVGVHYTTVVGYDAFVRQSFDGPSFLLGLQLGRF